VRSTSVIKWSPPASAGPTSPLPVTFTDACELTWSAGLITLSVHDDEVDRERVDGITIEEECEH